MEYALVSRRDVRLMSVGGLVEADCEHRISLIHAIEPAGAIVAHAVETALARRFF